MTAQEFLKELEYFKKEAAGYKHQMEVNLDYCKCYESALITIAKMCGWESDAQPSSCIGMPKDIDAIAIHAVQAVIDKHKQ